MMKYYVGQKAEFSKTITESDVCLFAGITGDFNPIHINQIEAEKSIFGERVVHGALTASLISTVIGCQLPGSGTIYISQTTNFIQPVKINDTITASVEIMKIEGSKASLSTKVFNQRGECVVEGAATVKLPKSN